MAFPNVVLPRRKAPYGPWKGPSRSPMRAKTPGTGPFQALPPEINPERGSPFSLQPKRARALYNRIPRRGKGRNAFGLLPPRRSGKAQPHLRERNPAGLHTAVYPPIERLIGRYRSRPAQRRLGRRRSATSRSRRRRSARSMSGCGFGASWSNWDLRCLPMTRSASLCFWFAILCIARQSRL